MRQQPYGVRRDTPDNTVRKQVGVQEFVQKTQRPDPGHEGRLITSQGILERAQGRDIFRTRYRSGSFTESHFTPGNDLQPHSIYHYSVRDNTEYSVKSNRATATRQEHKEQNLLFK